MSSDAAVYVSQVATIIQESYCTFSAFALLAFEWVITFDREVHLVWGRKVTGATVLFVMNRYWLFFQYISQVITAFPMSQRGCDVFGYMVLVGNGGPPLIWATFSVLRAYALTNRKWWIIPLVGAFFVPDVVLTAIYFRHLKPLQLPQPFNCVLASSLPQEEWIHFTIASRVCLIAGDLVVLAITWYSTFGIKRAAAGVKMRTSLTDSLLTNGTIYFVCLLILNMVNIFVNAFPQTSEVSAFQDPITSILVSRFLLNLRDTSTGRMGIESSSATSAEPSFIARPERESRTTTMLQFSRFVDPMGADLDHGLSSSTARSDSGATSEGADDFDQLGHQEGFLLEEVIASSTAPCDAVSIDARLMNSPVSLGNRMPGLGSETARTRTCNDV